MHTLRERVLYRYGLKHADKMVVQMKKQRENEIYGIFQKMWAKHDS